MFPQPELLKDAPGFKRDDSTTLYIHETEYGTDLIWYHPRSEKNSKFCCYQPILDMNVLYSEKKFFTAENPPEEEDLKEMHSSRSIICSQCGFHVWFDRNSVSILENSFHYVKEKKAQRDLYVKVLGKQAPTDMTLDDFRKIDNAKRRRR